MKVARKHVLKVARRHVLELAAGAVGLPSLSRIASAQSFPSRPVHMIVDLPAGLSPDVIARLMGPPLSQRLGQPVVIENRPGAGGDIGAEAVVRAPPDGYTLLVMISGNAANAALYPNLSFDFVRDIAAVAFLGYTPFAMVINPSLPAKTPPRVHCLCQGQSRQDQHGLTRHRHRFRSRRRIVQDDDRRRLCPRERLPRQLYARSAWWPGASRVYFDRPGTRLHSKQASCARLALTSAKRLDSAARCPRHRRVCGGL